MHGLGPLEGTIMQVMWSSDEPRSVRSIHSSLAADRKIAYTTVPPPAARIIRPPFWATSLRTGATERAY